MVNEPKVTRAREEQIRLMGHTSPEMLWRHYNRAVTQKHAKTFWKSGVDLIGDALPLSPI